MLAGRTIADVLQEARQLFSEAGLSDPASDARILIAGLLGLSSVQLVTQAQTLLTPEQEKQIAVAVERRLCREPVHRILGEREFYGLPLRLSAHTLEPRPDTEILVDAVLPYLHTLAREGATPHILDIGTGTGAIALALLKECPQAHGVGSDISSGALHTARINAERNGLQDRFETVRSSWFDDIEGRFHTIVSNPPYIRTGVIETLEPDVAQYDPVAALDGGMDGLDAYRVLASQAFDFLYPNGVIGVEIGYDQHQDVCSLFEANHFVLINAYKDYGGQDRVLLFAKCQADIAVADE